MRTAGGSFAIEIVMRGRNPHAASSAKVVFQF
jgi:hypothetical protein